MRKIIYKSEDKEKKENYFKSEDHKIQIFRSDEHERKTKEYNAQADECDVFIR